MTVVIADEGTGWLAIEITGVADTGNAEQGAFANPFGCDVHVLRSYLVTSVAASVGASNLTAGITTETGAASDVLNSIDVNGVSVDRAYNGFVNDPGAVTVTVPVAWTKDLFLTFTADATMISYVGTLYVEVLRTTVRNA
jgi:hypothetical protein